MLGILTGVFLFGLLWLTKIPLIALFTNDEAVIEIINDSYFIFLGFLFFESCATNSIGVIRGTGN